ncbi:Hsp20/alpha crystallin family protein [Nodularia sp. NIES-3585]|uniref:Hsp20/alpha crystallin family protein n=1 Tax=Nodularia sp. NIES-3585 TaxID=1973477 RepID=UPI000B5C36F3|nr:Hsp20/alpha crystallin family protein [Nodularia sp. NIES-3585]GAX37732.1 heat shock protein Hsp20 [Nodularia sp. NIES-3585]
MALIRWEPFREMEILRRQMDQLFSEMTADERSNSDISPAPRTAWVPAVELSDHGSDLLLRAEIPGVESKDLDVQVTQDAVSISGEHRYQQSTKSNGNMRSEFRYGKFQRIIPLPSKIQHQQVQADLKDGILTLSLPKMEPEKNKVFKVNFGQTQAATTSIESTDGK